MRTNNKSSTDNSTSNTRTISRRSFLATSLAVGAVGPVSGCLGSVGGGSTTVKIGAALPMSGAYSLIGSSTKAGFDLRLNQLDNKIDGKEVEVFYRDTETNPDAAVSVTQSLLTKEDVDFIVGPGTSAEGLAIMSQIEQNDVVWMNTIAGDYRIIKQGCLDKHFVTTPLEYQVSAPLAPYVYDNIADNVFLAYRDSAYGQASKDFFTTEFEEKGGNIVGEVAAPFGTEDFSSYLQQIQNADPDAVFAVFAGQGAITFVDQFHEQGLSENITLTGNGYLVGTNTMPVLGEAALGAVTIHPYTPEKQTDRNQEFVSNYQDATDSIPDAFACQGYDSLELINQAVTDTGGVDHTELINSLSDAETDSPRGYFKFDPGTHTATMDMDIRVARASDGEAPPHSEILTTLEKVGTLDWGCNLS